MFRRVLAMVAIVGVIAAGFGYVRLRESLELQIDSDPRHELSSDEIRQFQSEAARMNAANLKAAKIKAAVGSYSKTIGTYKGKDVQLVFKCYTDYCQPDGFVVIYADVPESMCADLGGKILSGNGLGYIYIGCVPIRM